MTSRSNKLLGPETRPCVQSESHSYSRLLLVTRLLVMNIYLHSLLFPLYSNNQIIDIFQISGGVSNGANDFLGTTQVILFPPGNTNTIKQVRQRHC